MTEVAFVARACRMCGGTGVYQQPNFTGTAMDVAECECVHMPEFTEVFHAYTKPTQRQLDEWEAEDPF